MSKKAKSRLIAEPAKSARSARISFPERFVRQASSPVLKKAAVTPPVGSRLRLRMAWTDERGDIHGSWSWGQRRDWTGEIWDNTLLPFLKGCECHTWAELERMTSGDDKRHKAYEISAICREAQNRLEEIELEDLDEVFRFRLTGRSRFYGFRIREFFFALWWDPEHQICPSNIQNRGKRRR